MATVLVTGANRGIGLAFCRLYQARGDGVIAVSRDPGSSALAALAKGGPGRLEPVRADVTDEAALAKAAKAAGDMPVDIVICNAGVMDSRSGIAGKGLDAAEWSRVMMTNVAGVFFTARAFLPHLKRAQAGKLAIISSMMGSSSCAGPGSLAYRASKAAAANLGLSLSHELKPLGIAVGIYHPGWVASDMGGRSAPVSPDDSASGLARRIGLLSLTTTGVFEDYNGKPYAF